MKVVLLAAGNDIHSVRWANQLSENGSEVHLCYVSNQKPSADKFSDKVILHELRIPAPYGYYINVFQLKKIIKLVKPDIINAHYSSGYGTLGRLAGFSPYLISVYGSDVYDFPYKRRSNMEIIKKNLNSADSIASTSFAMACQTSKLINYPVSDIHITPFGVDIERFSRKQVKKESNNIIIGSIKKLSPKYGIQYGILAINYLINNLLAEKGRDLNIKYHIYGEGEQKPELIELVEKHDLQGVVEFKGRIPNNAVHMALNEMDIFLGTSVLDSESFGVAIVEAMACEVPVVVTDVDGFKEVVDGGKSGVMVNRKDFKMMGEEILKLIEHPELRVKIGEIQRKRVIEEYNWSENVKKMEDIYMNLIEKSSV
ncbi:glycosyltransferase family 4 protein [Gracilibacillus oryzae]|uniref:Glycosyltransferase family 4 protein n=1 Tax=Gracilibacillus oryzae TaxID=1672701 RepID=A0A7C8L6U7_9BACI|nr:glycosyltransferase [Gracilibacillus oryzae]KAB8133673.1 glycosyltransferase family 4 protein [Gracilibacillus oryzae]